MNEAIGIAGTAKDVGVCGVGYEGISLDEFITDLLNRGVNTVVDVRLNAFSYKPGFSKKPLQAALEEAGISYLHRPMLGNAKENRDGYAQIDTAAAINARQVFRQRLTRELAVATLSEIAQLASTQRVALLCFERDEQHCHRQQVIEAVRKQVDGVRATFAVKNPSQSVLPGPVVSVASVGRISISERM